MWYKKQLENSLDRMWEEDTKAYHKIDSEMFITI